MSWFTFEELKDGYPFKKVQEAPEEYVTNTLIPQAEWFVQNYTGEMWSAAPSGDDAIVLGVAKNYTVMKILGGDENVLIARARGQPSFTVAGDNIPLDLNLSRNPFLSVEDQAILDEYRVKNRDALRTDKIVVRTQGEAYDEAGKPPRGATDYVSERPRYFRGF